MAFGTGSSNYLESETVKIEHAFTFNVSDRWDKPLKQAVDSWLDMGYLYAESFRFIAIGISAYFVMAGLAKLVEATRKTGDDTSSSSSSSSSRSKSSSSGSSSSSKDKSSSSTKDKKSSSKHKSSSSSSSKSGSSSSGSSESSSSEASVE